MSRTKDRRISVVRGRVIVRPSAAQRLDAIAEIIEAVDNRCLAADGPVTPTRLEITTAELRHIYALATKYTFSLRGQEEESK